MHKYLPFVLIWLVAAGCKSDVGPKKKVASDKITSHRGALWNHAHVLALRRVETGKYGGRGGIGSWRRGYMRYYLVLDGAGKQRRVYLYESQYQPGKGKGRGVDKLTLRASPDDRCVAYSKDGGRRWRFVRRMGPDFWFHFRRPDITTRPDHKNPCAKAPPEDKHFLALLVGTHRIYTDEMRGVLKVLALHPKNRALQQAFAQFMLTPRRRQFFHSGLRALWRPIQRITCDQPALRRVYLKRLKEHQTLGSRHHRNAMLILEACPRPDVQDGLAGLLWKRSARALRDQSRRVAARIFARITERRKGASPAALADAVKALPGAKPLVQAYIARALGSVPGADAKAALRTLITTLEAASNPVAAPARGRGDWPSFDQFVLRVKAIGKKDENNLVLRTARAALKR